MSTIVTLEYRRDDGEMTSSGRLLSNENGLITEEGLPFKGLEFHAMLQRLVDTLSAWPLEHPVTVMLQRTDREGLLAYRLDDKTVTLLRTDPAAAIKSFDAYTPSPSTVVKRVREERAPRGVQPVRAGNDTLADAFGDALYFKVRAHELECPGCGFWGMFTSPGLLTDLDRAGEVIKTTFVCPKKCKGRFVVTCAEKWGHVRVSYLLEDTKLEAFYFPRGWNEGRPWVTRESLQKMYNEYKAEKEKV